MAAVGRILGFLIVCAPLARAQVDIHFTRPGGAVLDSVGREETISGVEAWMTNSGAEALVLSAYELRFEGGDFNTGALCASHWVSGSVFDGLSPAWLHADAALANCQGNRRVSGVSGSLAVPLAGPALAPAVAVRIGSFDLAVHAPAGPCVAAAQADPLRARRRLDTRRGDALGEFCGSLTIPGSKFQNRTDSRVGMYFQSFVTEI